MSEFKEGLKIGYCEAIKQVLKSKVTYKDLEAFYFNYVLDWEKGENQEIRLLPELNDASIIIAKAIEKTQNAIDEFKLDVENN
jgi:hypothetical protein